MDRKKCCLVAGIVLSLLIIIAAYYAIVIRPKQIDKFVSEVQNTIESGDYNLALGMLDRSHYKSTITEQYYYEIGVYFTKQAVLDVLSSGDSINLNLARSCFRKCERIDNASRYLKLCRYIEDCSEPFCYSYIHNALLEYDDIPSAHDLLYAIDFLQESVAGEWSGHGISVYIHKNGRAGWREDSNSLDVVMGRVLGMLMPIGVSSLYSPDSLLYSFNLKLDALVAIDYDYKLKKVN